MTQRKTTLILWSALSLTLTTQAYAQLAAPDSADTSTPLDATTQTLSPPPQELLKRGQEARQAQEYERAYELHLRALWAMQAQRSATKQELPSAQETALTQALPTLRAQAMISSGVLGWASVLSDDGHPVIKQQAKVELFGAYASMGEDKKLEHILPSLVDKRDGSLVSYRIKRARIYMDERPTITRSKVLRWLCWGAPVACPLRLERQAQLATASLWPPLRYIDWYAYEGKTADAIIPARLNELNEQGNPKELFLSALRYCHGAHSSCVHVLAKGALKTKDPIMLTQARLLNLVWFYTTINFEDRFSLMLTYHKLMKASGEVKQARQWLAQVGVPLLINGRELPAWQLTRAADQLFEYRLNDQANKVLRHLELRSPTIDVKQQLISTYIKHDQLEAAQRLYNELPPKERYRKLTDAFLELLVRRKRGEQLIGYIEQLKHREERYRAYAKLALRVATDTQRPAPKLARALLAQATIEQQPFTQGNIYLEGRRSHLSALSALNAQPDALNLIDAQRQDIKAVFPTGRAHQLAQLAAAAVEIGDQAALDLAIKHNLTFLEAHADLLHYSQPLIEALAKAKMYDKLMAFILETEGIQERYRKTPLGTYIKLTPLYISELEPDPELITRLKQLILARAKAYETRSLIRSLLMLCIKAKQTKDVIELARTLSDERIYGSKYEDLTAWIAHVLIDYGEITAGLELYQELSEGQRFELLNTLCEALAKERDRSKQQLILTQLLTRADVLPAPFKARLTPKLVNTLAAMGRCEQATKRLLLATPADEQLEQVATACLYAHKPALALELIERISLRHARRARALIQVGYYMDLSGQSRLPEVQAILKRVAKALEAP